MSSDPISPYIYNNTVFNQTSDAPPVLPEFYFFSIGATFLTVGDYSTATASYPGPDSPQILPEIAPTRFDFSSQPFTSSSTEQLAYPFGTYTVEAIGSQITSTSSVSYQANYFTSTVPFVTNYSSLNGLNPENDFTIHYNSFTPDAHVTTGFTFLTIWNAATHQVVFEDSFQNPSSTAALIPANTLSPNTQYTFELTFSDRLVVGSSTQGFDVRTDGSFMTVADFVHQGIITTATLSVGSPVNGTIDAEPMSSDIGISLPDGAGGYVDKDWYQVTLNKGYIYSFAGTQTSITSGLMDISLYGQNGTQVHAAVEGTSPSFTFDTTYQSSATQTYYLAVSAGGPESTWRTATGDYSVSLTAQTSATTDQIPETIQSRVPLPLGTTTGMIDSSDLSGGPDGDYYQVALTGGEKYTFVASAGVSDSDTLDSVIVRLRDANGNILSTGDKTASGPNPSFDYTVPGSGTQTYFLAISASSVGSTNGVPLDAKTGQYSITVVDRGAAGQVTNISDPSSSLTGRNGIDALAANRLTAAQLIAANKQFVAEYIGDPIPGDYKYLSANYANSLISNHLSIVSIFQRHIVFDQNGVGIDPDPTDISTYTASQADSDAAAALAGAAVAGQRGGAIYFGVDADPGKKGSSVEKTNLGNVVAYFLEIESYFAQHGSPYSIGVYGAGDVLDAVKSKAGIEYSWLAYAPSWAGSDYSSPSIKQTINSTDIDQILIGNVPVDLDVALAPDIGAWGNATVSIDSPQDAPIAGSNGLFAIQGTTTGANASLTVGAQGTSAIVSNSLTGDIKDIFSQFSEFLFNGGVFNDSVNLLPLSSEGITNHTVFFNGNDGDDTLDGSATDTSIVASGGSGKDTLIGGPANDVLNGDTGSDVLTGRAGADTFVFGVAALADGKVGIFDRITDYKQGNTGAYNAAEGDQIDLSALLSAAFQSGQPISALVRAIEVGSAAMLQINPVGTGFVTIAQLDGLHIGDSINAVLDASQLAGISIPVIAAPPPPNPLAPPGATADMVLHRADGTFEIYNIGGNVILAGYSLGQIASEWQFTGLGRFFGSDSADMMLRNTVTGSFQVYDTTNNNITATALLGQVGLEWNVAGFGHFMAGGAETDMMLTFSNNGVTSFEAYGISDNKITTAALFGRVGTEWQVAGFGPGNGTTDMVVKRDDSNNAFTYGLYHDIKNNQFNDFSIVGRVGSEWNVVGFADLTGNGTSDMIVRRTGDNAFGVYHDINDKQFSAFTLVGPVGSEWQVMGFGPIGQAARDEMLTRRNSDGTFAEYTITNNQFTFNMLGAVGTDWAFNGIAADPPTGSTAAMGDSSQGAQLVQAMAGFGGSSGATDGLNSGFLNADTQPLLTMPQHT